MNIEKLSMKILLLSRGKVSKSTEHAHAKFRGNFSDKSAGRSNTLKFFVEKRREAFALQKLLTFFSTKYIGKFKILTFEIITKR